MTSLDSERCETGRDDRGGHVAVTLAVHTESSALLDALRRELLRQPGGPEVETLMDPGARAHRDSGVWEFLSVACGTGGADEVRLHCDKRVALSRLLPEPLPRPECDRRTTAPAFRCWTRSVPPTS